MPAKRTELRQALFDVMALHLLAQRSKSLMDVTDPEKEIAWERPAYRGKAGKKCPIGVLIDDRHYSPDIEGHAVTREPVQQAIATSGWAVADPKSMKHFMPLFTKMQDLHDCIKPNLWLENLHEIAAEFNLSTALLPPPPSLKPRAG